MKKIIALCLFMMASFTFASGGSSIAIDGYDTVAYFTENVAKKGSTNYTAKHNGHKYLFSSKKNRDEFKANPEKFAPQFAGYCAFGVTLGKKFKTDPKVFAVVNNKLYLNLNPDIQAKWNADQAAMIKKGHAKWPSIK